MSGLHLPIKNNENIKYIIPKEAQVLYGLESPTIKGSDCKGSNLSH